MSKPTGFLEIDRRERKSAPASERVRHFHEFSLPWSQETVNEQATRCMDCGVPFCQSGCPVSNRIPDWNQLTGEADWKSALELLHSTNNFPEWTGRVCPAPCEASCTLNLQDQPVTIKSIEAALVEEGFLRGWIQPQPAKEKTGKKIAIVGSGPAGLAAAQQLVRRGHEVHVFEKNRHPGGLLRYGIPDFKLEKQWVDRRLQQLKAEGVHFHCNIEVGNGLPLSELKNHHDALLLAIGAEQARDLKIPGRDLSGIHFAMDYLRQQNERLAHEPLSNNPVLHAMGKRVIVIGGGDTGADCVGTALRQGALSVTQLELMPAPPQKVDKAMTWPAWPHQLRISTSLEEGGQRLFSTSTLKFMGSAEGNIQALEVVTVDRQMNPVAEPVKLQADLVLLAMGFTGVSNKIPDYLAGVSVNERGQVLATDYRTNQNRIYAAGDARRGQSLVVWAICEGREAAQVIDTDLHADKKW